MSGKIIMFLEEPAIETEGPKATHVTVSSPDAEYTACKDVPTEKKVERTVKVDTGDTFACQVVAEQLLDRWGNEQVSITGTAAFVVGLDFREKVKVKIPTAGIDGEYILQRKEHNLSELTTNLTVGDIILSDDELLARILADLELTKRG